jgi:hypothetical protein
MSYSNYKSKKSQTFITPDSGVIENRPYSDYVGKIQPDYIQPPKCECNKGKYSNYKKFNSRLANEAMRSDIVNMTLSMERIRESISEGIIGLLEDELMDSDFFKPLFQASVAGIQPPPPKIEIPDDKAIESDVQVLLPDFRAETSTLLDEEKVYVVGLKKNYELVVKLATDEHIPESNALTFASIIHERLGEIFEQEDYSVLYKAYQAQNPDIANILSQRSLSVDDKRKLMDVMLVEATSTYEKYYGTPTKTVIREFERRKQILENKLFGLIDEQTKDQDLIDYSQLILDFAAQSAKAELAKIDAENKFRGKRKQGAPRKLESRTAANIKEFFKNHEFLGDKKHNVYKDIKTKTKIGKYLN